MQEDKHRYFIELQIDGHAQISRRNETQVRRAQAEQFVGKISQWLQEQDQLKDKVASIAITALGQVLITCERDIINRIRDDENLNIAAIRSGKSLADSLQRMGGL